eukprot:s1417_g1.t1
MHILQLHKFHQGHFEVNSFPHMNVLSGTSGGAMATYQFLQGLPRETQHAFVASLSPRSRSDFSAYITSMENDLAQKKEAFTLRGDTRDLELVDEDCGSLSESDTDSDVDPDVELQELLAEEEALQKSIAQFDIRLRTPPLLASAAARVRGLAAGL